MDLHLLEPAADAPAVRSSELLGFPPDARVPELLAQARIDEVAREFRAQIAAVVDAALAPTHLDWHCLADGGRDDIPNLTVSAAVHERDELTSGAGVRMPGTHPFLGGLSAHRARSLRAVGV